MLGRIERLIRPACSRMCVANPFEARSLRFGDFEFELDTCDGDVVDFRWAKQTMLEEVRLRGWQSQDGRLAC